MINLEHKPAQELKQCFFPFMLVPCCVFLEDNFPTSRTTSAAVWVAKLHVQIRYTFLMRHVFFLVHVVPLHRRNKGHILTSTGRLLISRWKTWRRESVREINAIFVAVGDFYRCIIHNFNFRNNNIENLAPHFSFRYFAWSWWERGAISLKNNSCRNDTHFDCHQPCIPFSDSLWYHLTIAADWNRTS